MYDWMKNASKSVALESSLPYKAKVCARNSQSPQSPPEMRLGYFCSVRVEESVSPKELVTQSEDPLNLAFRL